MTRDELLKVAESSIATGFNNHWYNDPAYSQTAFLHAIACTLLAKEIREGGQSLKAERVAKAKTMTQVLSKTPQVIVGIEAAPSLEWQAQVEAALLALVEAMEED